MPLFLARSISVAKWHSSTNIAAGEIAADAVTTDMKTQDNALSFWTCNPADTQTVDDVALALAARADHISKMDLVWVEETEVAKVPLKVVPEPGDTPAKTLVNNHRNVVGIDVVRLCRLSQTVAKAIHQKQTRRLTVKQVRDCLNAGIQAKKVDKIDLNPKLAGKL